MGERRIKHGSKQDYFTSGYSLGLNVEKTVKSPTWKKVEDWAAHRLKDRVFLKNNKSFSEGYNLGKKDMEKALKVKNLGLKLKKARKPYDGSDKLYNVKSFSSEQNEDVLPKYKKGI